MRISGLLLVISPVFLDTGDEGAQNSREVETAALEQQNVTVLLNHTIQVKTCCWQIQVYMAVCRHRSFQIHNIPQSEIITMTNNSFTMDKTMQYYLLFKLVDPRSLLTYPSLYLDSKGTDLMRITADDV